MTDTENNRTDNTAKKAGLLPKIIIYLLGSSSIILPFLWDNITLLWLFFLPTVSLFSVFFATCGPRGILLLLLPLFATLIFNNPIFILITLTSLAAAISLENSFKKKKSGIEAVRAGFITNVIAICVLFVVIAFLYTNGSVAKLLSAVGTFVDSLFKYVASILPDEYGSVKDVFISYAAVFKSVLVGAFLSVQMLLVCISYFIAHLVSTVFRTPLPSFGEKAFDLRTERVSAVIFLISFAIAAFIPTNPIKPNLIIIAASNLYSVLSPLYFCIGIYYLIRIKYRIEKSNFISLILFAVLSFFAGPQILIWFVTLEGSFYSIKPDNNLNRRRYS